MSFLGTGFVSPARGQAVAWSLCQRFLYHGGGLVNFLVAVAHPPETKLSGGAKAIATYHVQRSAVQADTPSVSHLNFLRLKAPPAQPRRADRLHEWVEAARDPHLDRSSLALAAIFSVFNLVTPQRQTTVRMLGGPGDFASAKEEGALVGRSELKGQ